MEAHNEKSDGAKTADLDSGLPAPVRRFERHITKRVVSGFVLLVPLLISLWVVFFVFSIIDDSFRKEDGLLRPLLEGRPWDFWGVGVVTTLGLLYLTGSFFTGKRARAWQAAILTRIPVVRTIYGVARQATDALTSPTGHHFSRVVMVEWPRPGVGAMGFVMGHLGGHGEGEEALVAVYIPTVPNPTSGMLAFFPESDITETNITVQDAMKTVFSGGMVLPDMPARLMSIGARAFEESSKN